MTHSAPPYVGNQPRSTRALMEWLGQGATVAAREPSIPIVDPHHHLFGAAGDPLHYELPDLEADLASGHRIIGTVYVEAYDSGWHTTGPEAIRPVGEVEKIVGLTRAPLALPGQALAVAIDGLGTLHNTLVAEGTP